MANLFPNDDANALVPNFNIEFVPNPGHAHFANNNNNNGWIEWDVPLGEMDEPMVDSESNEEETNDKDDDGDVVDEPKPSTYDVGGPSTAIAAQPQVIDDLYNPGDNLRDRPGSVDEEDEEVSADPATALHESRLKNQQWQTTVAEIYSREALPTTHIADPERNSARGPGNVEGAGNAGGPERAQPARDCTFLSFMKCGPTQFYGKEGAIELCRWFEKIESTFGISECVERNKVKFAAATLQGRALTWWNTQVATLDLAEANGKSWDDMKKMMLEEFCPEEEISRMEDELRNLSQYIKGLPSYIQGETYSSKPTTLNEAIRMAHGLMEHKVQGWKEKNADQNKRKWEGGNQGNNQGNRNNNRGDYRDNRRHNQNNNRRNGGARAMTQAQGENVNQGGHAPKCNRCNMFHFGNCPVKCNKCGKRGHIARDCRGKGVATGANAEPIRVCFKCGDPNHLANSELCPEKKKAGWKECKWPCLCRERCRSSPKAQMW
ncbi:putative reverse transcriptase domain-containing protein [Tanacetum coccineum]